MSSRFFFTKKSSTTMPPNRNRPTKPNKSKPSVSVDKVAERKKELHIWLNPPRPSPESVHGDQHTPPYYTVPSEEEQRTMNRFIVTNGQCFGRSSSRTGEGSHAFTSPPLTSDGMNASVCDSFCMEFEVSSPTLFLYESIRGCASPSALSATPTPAGSSSPGVASPEAQQDGELTPTGPTSTNNSRPPEMSLSEGNESATTTTSALLQRRRELNPTAPHSGGPSSGGMVRKASSSSIVGTPCGRASFPDVLPGEGEQDDPRVNLASVQNVPFQREWKDAWKKGKYDFRKKFCVNCFDLGDGAQGSVKQVSFENEAFALKRVPCAEFADPNATETVISEILAIIDCNLSDCEFLAKVVDVYFDNMQTQTVQESMAEEEEATYLFLLMERLETTLKSFVQVKRQEKRRTNSFESAIERRLRKRFIARKKKHLQKQIETLRKLETPAATEKSLDRTEANKKFEQERLKKERCLQIEDLIDHEEKRAEFIRLDEGKAFDELIATASRYKQAIENREVLNREVSQIGDFHAEQRVGRNAIKKKESELFLCLQRQAHADLQELNKWNSLEESFKAGQMDESFISRVGYCILHAFDELHTKRDIIHNDLSMKNIMLTSDNSAVKLMDFGCSLKIFYDESTGQPIFPKRTVKGTSAYQAPELHSGFFGKYRAPLDSEDEEYLDTHCPFGSDPRITPAADLFSLGIILLELFLGFCPVEPLQPGDDRDEYEANLKTLRALKEKSLRRAHSSSVVSSPTAPDEDKLPFAFDATDNNNKSANDFRYCDEDSGMASDNFGKEVTVKKLDNLLPFCIDNSWQMARMDEQEETQPSTIPDYLRMSKDFREALGVLLSWNPRKRTTASEVLELKFFKFSPSPTDFQNTVGEIKRGLTTQSFEVAQLEQRMREARQSRIASLLPISASGSYGSVDNLAGLNSSACTSPVISNRQQFRGTFFRQQRRSQQKPSKSLLGDPKGPQRSMVRKQPKK